METRSSLLEVFEQLIEGWREVFPQARVFERARRLTLGLLVSLRLHLISNAICATGRQFVDWTSDYRLCSRRPWDPRRLFDVVFDHLAKLLSSPQAPVLLALDDTLLSKTGRHIPGVSVGKDPMSPPFHVNLRYGLRFLQASLLVAPPDGAGAARALPVRFEFAPPARKPKTLKRAEKARKARALRKAQRKAQSAKQPKQANRPKRANKKQETPEEAAYKQEKKLRCLTQVGLNAVRNVRESLNQRPDLRERLLITAGDGSYTNRTMVRGLPERAIYIGRIRKDAKLYWPVEPPAGKANGRPRRYGPPAPTPEQILHDESIPWQTVRCFAAGRFHETQVKVIRNVYWRKGGFDLPLQVVVIRPLGYRLRKGGKLLYRQPAFLICTDPALSLQMLVQTYIYRWEIECNHRDEKSLLGVGQGQVRNPEAVRRLPPFQVAGYSLLMLASLLSSGFQRQGGEFLPLPKWRRVSESVRPSLLDLLNLLRHQIFVRGAHVPVVGFEDFIATAPAVVKDSKPPLSAETLATLAA